VENRQVELLSNIVNLLKEGNQQNTRGGRSVGSFSADDLVKVSEAISKIPKAVDETNKKLGEVPNVIRNASQMMSDYGKAVGGIAVSAQQIDKFSGGLLGKLFDATGMKKISGKFLDITKNIRSWGSAFKNADDGAKRLLISIDGMTSLVGGMFKTIGSIVGSAVKGVVAIGTGITKFIVGSLSSVLTTATKISKFLVTLPVGIANRAAEMGNKLRQELVEVIGQAAEDTKEYFDLMSNGGKSMTQLRGIAEGSLLSFQSVNSTMTKLFGFGAQGAANMIRELSQGINNMGIYADVFADSTTKSATSIEFFTRMTKGMGMAADDIAYVMRDAVKNGEHYYVTMTRMKEASDAASYEFGVNRKLLSKNFFQLRKDITNFGHLSEIELMKVAARATQMGVEMKDLAGVFNKFGTFEDAANSAALLSQTFGMNIDALQLIRAEDPMEIVEMFRQSMLATGRSFEDLNRHEKSLMASHTGMSVEALKTTMNYRTLGKSFEDIKKIMNDQKPEERQIRAMKDMSSSMKEQLKIMQKKDFFTAFLDGLTNTIMYAGKLGKTMRKVSKNMQSFYEEGLRIKKEDLNKILEPFDEVLNKINDAFSVDSLRLLKMQVVENVKLFVQDIMDPQLCLTGASWFDIQRKWDNKISGLFSLQRLLDDQGFIGKLVKASGQMIQYIIRAIALAGPGIVKGLGNAFEGVVNWLTSGKISEAVNIDTFAQFLGMSTKDCNQLLERLKASFNSIKDYLFGPEEKMAYEKGFGSMIDNSLTLFPTKIQKVARKKGLFERLGDKFKEVFKIKEGDGIFSSLFDSLTKKIKELSENKKIRDSLENIGEHIMKGMSKASKSIGKMVDAIMTSAKSWLEKNGYITRSKTKLTKEEAERANVSKGTSLSRTQSPTTGENLLNKARKARSGNVGAVINSDQKPNTDPRDILGFSSSSAMVDSAYKGGTLLTNNAFKGGTKAAATTLGKFKNAAKAAGKAVPLLNVGVEAYLGNANYQSAVNLIDHFVSEGAITEAQGLAILDEALSDQTTNSAWSASASTIAGIAGTALGAGFFSALTGPIAAMAGDYLASETAAFFGSPQADESAFLGLKDIMKNSEVFKNMMSQLKRSQGVPALNEGLNEVLGENQTSMSWVALQNSNMSDDDFKYQYNTNAKAYMRNTTLNDLASYGGDSGKLDREDVVALIERVKEDNKDAKEVMKSLKNFLEAGSGDPQVIVTVDGYALTSHITTLQRRQAQDPSNNTGTDSRYGSRNLGAETR
jgi:Mg2+ and Co2+ transporter CorA